MFESPEQDSLPPLLSDFEIEMMTLEELHSWDTGKHTSPVEMPVPEGLDELTPGPFLGVMLAGLDRSRLSGFDLVSAMRAESKMVSYFQALLYESMDRVAHRSDPEFGLSDEAHEFASDEIRAALTLTRRAADSELALAGDLFERLPAVWKALHRGDIDVRRARVLANETAHLSREEAGHVVDDLIDAAPTLTTGQLGSRIRRLVFETDPNAAKTRYSDGLEERRTFTEVNPDGTGNLMGLNLPIARLAAANRRIHGIAMGLKTGGEPRSLDQIRADVFLDLLSGACPDSTTTAATVNIQVELATLVGLDQRAGDIPGYGPVIADIARQVAAAQTNTTWTYTVTDQGHPVATGTTRRRPTRSVIRQVTAANLTCVFPGCRMPATQCDLDHTQDWAEGGPTTTRNLAPLCRHDHRLKHEGDWKLHQSGGGGFAWISRLGHTYTTAGRSP